MDFSELHELVEKGREERLQGSKSSLLYYLEHVVINSAPNPKKFGSIAEPWQRELIAAKVPAFESLAGLNPGYTGPLSFFDVLPRGHDKSSLEGRFLSWLLIASRRPISAYVLAADGDQGSLILEAMESEARLNPWIASQLKFTRRSVTGPSGAVKVIPADSSGAFGLRGNLYICDEITNWPDRGYEMWKAVISGREKVPGSLFCILTNAGLLDSWQYEYLKRVEQDNDWKVFAREGQLASWMDKSRVDKLRLLLPPSESERVYDNKWIDPATEHDYLRRTEIQACVDEAVLLDLRIQFIKDPNIFNYIVGVDYGPKRDRTALCVLHVDSSRRCIVDRLDVWQGSPEDPISIERVETWIKQIRSKFNPSLFVLDPYNLESTCQWMEKEHMPLERFNFRGGAGNFEMAQHLRSLIVNKQLLWYPTAGDLKVVKYGRETIETFTDELAGLRVKKMSYGYRFDHENQKHDDRCFIAGTLVETFNGPVEIENIIPGTQVLTRNGYEIVLESANTGVSQVLEVSFESGIRLIGTGNHPVWTKRGWVPLSKLTEKDEAFTWSKLWNTAEELIADTQILKSGTTECTFNAMTNGRPRHDICIGTNGQTPMGRSQRGILFTTRTKIRLITPSRILNVCLDKNMQKNTWSPTEQSVKSGLKPTRENASADYRESGSQKCKKTRTELYKELRSQNALLNRESPRHISVSNAENSARPNQFELLNTALTDVDFFQEGEMQPLRVVQVKLLNQQPVYNLSVSNLPEYFANGILVHNCTCVASAALRAFEFSQHTPVRPNPLTPVDPNLIHRGYKAGPSTLSYR